MKSGRYFLLLILAVFTISGCGDDTFTPIDRGSSFLHIVSGVTQDTFNIVFDYYNADNRVIGNFYHHRNWPLTGYADLTAGGQPDEFGVGKLYLLAMAETNNHNEFDTLMPKRPIVLDEGKKASVCFADSAGEVAMAFIEDEFSTPDASSAAVRFINLKEANPTATIRSTDQTINMSADFLSGSSFVNVPTGTYDLEVTDGAGGVLATYNGFILGGGGVFSFYFSGNDIEFYRH